MSDVEKSTIRDEVGKNNWKVQAEIARNLKNKLDAKVASPAGKPEKTSSNLEGQQFGPAHPLFNSQQLDGRFSKETPSPTASTQSKVQQAMAELQLTLQPAPQNQPGAAPRNTHIPTPKPGQ